MDGLQLLIDLHKDAPRQGPGSDDHTALAITLSGLANHEGIRVADIGCGSGASTLVLARTLKAHITAVDLFPEFLEELDRTVSSGSFPSTIETMAASMDCLPFDDNSLDAIWSEGAIYNIGFDNGIRSWNRFLKPGGILAVAALTWLTADRPEELERHWLNEYPEVAKASCKIAQLEDAGCRLIGYFPLPPECWLQNYYRPMQERFASFLQRNGNTDQAREIVKAEEAEIDLYERFADFVSYGFYIARKAD